MIDNFQSQISAKGKEINDFREKYNIRFQGETEAEQKSNPAESAQSSKATGSSGVLVANS